MADLLLADFAQRVGDSFEIVAGELAVVLTLGDARAIPGSARAGGGFRLEFSGPPDPVLPQGTYPFSVGSEMRDIFIVPLGPEAGAMRYEALFF